MMIDMKGGIDGIMASVHLKDLLQRCMFFLVIGQCFTEDTHTKVIGFLQLHFSPGFLLVKQGEEVVGNVNITVPEHRLAALQGSSLHVTCSDDTVALANYRQYSTFVTKIYNVSTHFTVRVLGGKLGRAKLRFYITNNASSEFLSDIVTTESIKIDKVEPLLGMSKQKEMEYGYDNPPPQPQVPIITSIATTPLPIVVVPSTSYPKITSTTQSSTVQPTTGTSSTSSTNEPKEERKRKPPSRKVYTDDTQSKAANKIRHKNKKNPHKSKTNGTELKFIFDNPIFEEFEDSTPPSGVKEKYRWIREAKSTGRLLSKSEMLKLQEAEERRRTENLETYTASTPEHNVWWIAQEYQIVVHVPHNSVAEYIQYIVLVVTGLILVGVGGQIDIDEVLYLLKKPVAIFVTAIARFLVMPALSIGLSELLHPYHHSASGMLALSCAPSEGAAILLLLLIEADLTLAATVMLANNFISLGLLPLWGLLFQHHIYLHPDSFAVPFQHIFLLLLFQLTAIAGGFTLRKKWPKLCNKMWSIIPIPAAITVFLLIVTEIYRNYFTFDLVTVNIFFMAAMLAAGGYIFGAAISFISREPVSRMIVITVETGVRTTFITGVLLNMTLSKPEDDIGKTAPTVWCLLSLLSSFIAVMVYTFYKRYNVRKYAPTECTYLDSRDDLSLADVPEILDAKETAI